MIIYFYECLKCGKLFEIKQSIQDKPLTSVKHRILVSNQAVKPYCNGKVKRVIQGGQNIIFKGKGFYCNDYPKKNKNKL